MEIRNCSVWLDRELGLIRPKIIILLGKIASNSFLEKYLNSKEVPNIWGKSYQLTNWKEIGSVFFVPHPYIERRNPIKVDEIYKNIAVQIKDIMC
jgi:uracil-DNA glycosylase family 4